MAITDEALAIAAQHYQAGQLAPAEQLCRQILQADPAHADALHLLGWMAYQAKRWDEAIGCYQEALRVHPERAEIHNSLASALMDRGQLTEALGSVQNALQLKPDFAEAHGNQGMILKQMGRWQEAEASYRLALSFRPEFPEARNHLGAVLIAQGQYAEAEVAFRDFLRLWNDSAEVYVNLGMALAGQGKTEEALACYEQALRLKPDSADAVVNMAAALAAEGKIDQAIACYRRAAAMKPGMPFLDNCLLFTLLYAAAYDPETAFAEHVRWARQFAAISPEPRPLAPVHRDPDRRLRIGYVSGDFREHVLGRYCERVIAAHDHRQFEVFCYSTVLQEDQRTQRIRDTCDHWRLIATITDDQAAEVILNDRIDLLIDLTGHSAGTRLGVFARKPAPIQVSHFGYPASTGLATMDYRLTDTYFDPPGLTEHLYSEKLLRMPEVCWCYVPWDNTEISALPARGTGAVTFASISTPNKVTEDIIALWAQILKELPESRMLVVLGPGGAGEQRVRSTFATHGIDSARLALVPRQKLDAYLRLLCEVDIVLDTYPFTGCNTTADALWMGVPVVSHAGRSCVSRLAVAALVVAGLEDLVAESSSAYVEAAVRLARDIPRLRELRGQLRDRVRRTLGDVERFTRQLEAAYRDMWQAHCKARAKLAGGRRRAWPFRESSRHDEPILRTSPRALKMRHVARRVGSANEPVMIEIIAATTLSRDDFWNEAPLGLSLRRLANDARLIPHIAFANERGLPDVYNERILAPDGHDMLVFLHDDVWIEDGFVADRVSAGLETYDVIGVAGNRRRLPNQATWLFVGEQLGTWDTNDNLSGWVAHGKTPFGPIRIYGPVPAPCELLDGVFLAARKSALLSQGVLFDPRFDFHFYDMDFCRSARQKALRLGTWPICLTHRSMGFGVGSPPWMAKYREYIAKWKC